jgi:hypothetical protein
MKQAKSVSKTSILRVLAVLLPIVVLLFWWLGMANFLIGRGLMIAYPGIESTFKGAWFEWDGDVVARDVVLMPFDADDETAIRFERVHVETPGWFWFLRNLFDRRLKRAHLDRMHVTLEGGESVSGFDLSLGDLGPIGGISASPFEAEGCKEDTIWVREELRSMGLDPQATRLEFDYRIEGELLHTMVRLETPRSSRVQYDRRSRLEGSRNALLLDGTPLQVLGERWEVQDQGFVSARNRHCGKKDGIDARRFLDRHVAAIERILATAGLAWDAETRTMYKRFARDGGTLAFGGDYVRPLDEEQWAELSESGEILPLLNARIEHNGRAHPVGWQRFSARPLAGMDDGEPTWALIERERSGRLVAEPVAATAPDGTVATATSASAPAAAPPAEASAATSPATALAANPGGDAAAAAPGDSAAPQAPPEVAAADAPAAPDAPAAASETPAETAVASATDNSEATAASASSATETVPPPTAAAPVAAPSPYRPPPMDPATAARIKAPSNVAVAANTRGPRLGSEVEWPQLLQMRGRTVRIWTVHNPPRTVDILTTEGGALRVTTRVGGGVGEYTIQREAFIKATLIR